jgi:hypothetical protein
VEKLTPEGPSWIDGELARSKFRDERQGQAYKKNRRGCDTAAASFVFGGQPPKNKTAALAAGRFGVSKLFASKSS